LENGSSYSKRAIPEALEKLSCDGFVVFSPDLSMLFDKFIVSERFNYQQIPEMSPFPQGSLFVGDVGEKRLLCMESHSDQTELENLRASVVPVHIAKQIGVNRGFVFGTARPSPRVEAEIGLITDQINLTGLNPLIGPNENALGVRFPDMTSVYDPGIQSSLEELINESNLFPQRGVLVGLHPDQHSPTDIQLDSLSEIGPYFLVSHLVAEVIAMRHAGFNVSGAVVLREIREEKLSNFFQSTTQKIF